MTEPYKNDTELFALMERELFTAVVGDVLDTMGLQKQFLPQGIGPISEHMRVIGRAMPVLEKADVADQRHRRCQPVDAKALGLLFEAIDDPSPRNRSPAARPRPMRCGVS